MVFTSPSWVPPLQSIPDSTLVGDFVLDGPQAPDASDDTPLLACADSGKTYTLAEIKEKVDFLSRALSRELGWLPNEGDPWDKVLGIYSFNTVRWQVAHLTRRS